MKRIATILAVTLVVAACQERPAGEPVVRAELGDAVPRDQLAAAETVPVETANESTVCRSISFESVPLTHCMADPELHSISTGLAPASGERFGTIEGWAAGRDESRITFVMNGGMYGDDLKAIGYFVRDEDRLVELNRGEGAGNFYMKPNGVFFGTGGNWRILDSETFLRTVGTRPEFGTQSGPMLVIGGELHPNIQENGPSKAIRNGVGIDSDGKAHFVISDAPLSFGQLARFFRDELETPNALFLDGNVSSLWDPSSGRMDARRVGPLLVVETK
ncbi:phosphodiester glycosidase family protein [uncultured Erythrobacter sp.]|uniref:phosphodiester glycosidase family protein n=1 Tax=uncultured Erythrobacter sp. TaxID=263913 RepID=UPI00263021C2|nr:phosphodiester glycosidase family protein [uncultured Erythrobacter sp.]